MNSSERNLMDTQPTKNATVTSLPDELIVRMAHEAGWLEAEGKIKVGAWEDLQIAIRDAINKYYDNSSEKNPFVIEDILDSILLERFLRNRKSNRSPLSLHRFTLPMLKNQTIRLSRFSQWTGSFNQGRGELIPALSFFGYTLYLHYI